MFEVLKSFKDSYFSERYSYETFEFNDEFHEIDDEGESNDDIDDYDENKHVDIRNNFALQEMKVIIDWVDKHPYARFSIVSNRFRKVKKPNCILRFRKCIENNVTRLEKLKKIKEFMTNEFYIKRAIEKEAVHDDNLKLCTIQKAKELERNTFKDGKSFINMLKKENRISTRQHNKLIIRPKLDRKVCILNSISKI